jgi:hypothetical protein
VFILKEVKVVCFDTLLQVLILNGLYCTKIVQNWLFQVTTKSEGIRFQKGAGAAKNRKAAVRLPRSRNPH